MNDAVREQFIRLTSIIRIIHVEREAEPFAQLDALT